MVERCGRQWAELRGAFLCLSWLPYLPGSDWCSCLMRPAHLEPVFWTEQPTYSTSFRCLQGLLCHTPPTSHFQSLWLGSCDLGALYVPSFLLSELYVSPQTSYFENLGQKKLGVIKLLTFWHVSFVSVPLRGVFYFGPVYSLPRPPWHVCLL